jgi:hypothetical protein
MQEGNARNVLAVVGNYLTLTPHLADCLPWQTESGELSTPLPLVADCLIVAIVLVGDVRLCLS